jgi:hypothetical protein
MLLYSVWKDDNGKKLKKAIEGWSGDRKKVQV